LERRKYSLKNKSKTLDFRSEPQENVGKSLALYSALTQVCKDRTFTQHWYEDTCIFAVLDTRVMVSLTQEENYDSLNFYAFVEVAVR